MKRLLLFIVLSISISSFSQNEFFPDDSAVWTGSSVQWCGQNCAYGTWLRVWVDTVQADSIVGSHSYKRLLQTYPNFVPDHFALYRMDTTEQQLWWIPKDSTTEFMYFDYDEGYVVGDTVLIAHYPYFYNFDQCYFNLESIDSILIDSEYFLTYEFWPIYQLNSGHACADGLTVSERLISTSFPFTSY